METQPNYVIGEDGKTYLELHDPEDEMRRALNPETGTELEHQEWQDVDPDLPAPPLLDLPSVWQNVGDGVRVPTTADDIKVSSVIDINEQNAIIIVRELKFYLLAMNKVEGAETDENDIKDKGDDGKIPSSHVEKSAESEQVKGHERTIGHSEGGSTEDEEGKTKKGIKQKKSIYGASVLLKLQWEDRTKQKNVPKMDYTELGMFIGELKADLRKVHEKNQVNAKAIFDAIALDVTPILFARLLNGIETGNSVLETACFDLLMLCTRHANPKEMHLGIQAFYKKVDSIYMQATSYYVYDPLVRIWTSVILRIPRKRHAFLMDFIKVYESMAKASTGWIYEHEGHVDDPDQKSPQCHLGRCDDVPNIVFEFYIELAELQNEHRRSSKAIRERVDIQGRALPSFAMLDQMSFDDDEVDSVDADNDVSEQDDIESDDTKQRPAKNPLDVEAADWVAERAVLLARALLTQNLIWSKLPLPSGEERDVPKKERKARKINIRSGEHEKAENNLCRVIMLVQKLGWTNPVLACQGAMTGLSLDLVRREHEAIGNHVGTDERKKKEVKNSRYSIPSVGCFLCGCLRTATRQRIEAQLKNLDTKSNGSISTDGPEDADAKDSSNDPADPLDLDEYKVDFTGSGFDLLQPMYAFELTLPYLMAVVGQSCIPSKMAGLITVRAFLDQVPVDDCINGYEDLLEERCGTRTVGRDVSFFGLAQHVLRSVGLLNDPRHRRFAYETFQAVVQRCKHPAVRYSLVEAMFERVVDPKAIEAQLVTELKDAVLYSDQLAWGTSPAQADSSYDVEWSRAQAVHLKTRFVHMMLPRYFMPRKEMLSITTVIVSVANTCVYIAGSDVRHAALCDDDEDRAQLKQAIQQRMAWVAAMVRMGKECVRALGSVADHDRKVVPKSKLIKQSFLDAKELYSASGKALHQCMTALFALDLTLDRLSSADRKEQPETKN